MEDESPVDRIGEMTHEHALEARERWLTMSALMSALFAVFAAIAGLRAGHDANEAMLRQIAASDAWNYYQAKGIKAAIVEYSSTPDAAMKAEHYRAEQATIKTDAEQKQLAAEALLKRHEILARAVTLFQVAIGMIAIAVLARKHAFLWVAGTLGCLGFGFFFLPWLG